MANPVARNVARHDTRTITSPKTLHSRKVSDFHQGVVSSKCVSAGAAVRLPLCCARR
jgi:hypothetical protein